MFKFLIVFVLCFQALSAVGNDIHSVGMPYVENFSKSVYRAGNQNWSVTVDERDIMYFGNSEGLLSFDGSFWQLHHMPNNLIVRAVVADKKGKIYTGGFGELGYWAYDKKAHLKYYSLKHLLPKNYQFNEEVWKIYVDGDKVIFQTFGAILIYRNQKIELLQDNSPYLFLLNSGQRFFIESIDRGLCELKNNKLNFIPAEDLAKIEEVLTVMPFANGQFLIGTSKNGLFLYDGQIITPWNVPASNFLKNAQLNNGVKISDKYFAFGTILNGVLIIDKSGNIIQHINKANGLQNNTVLSLFVDKSQNLWAGLDNGIDRIELNSPLSFYFDKSGVFGTVYSSIIHNGKIYLGTNQGLFQSDWETNAVRRNFNFTLIPNSQGQVWELKVIDGELFCGHNSGTFKVKGATITRISAVNGGWTLRKFSQMGDKLLQGTYTGLAVFDKGEDNTYSFSHKIEGFNEPSRHIEQDIKGNIWVSHAYKGIYKLRLSEDLKKVSVLKNYTEKNGLPSNYSINVFNLNGLIVFSSKKGFYVYDEITDRFKPYQELNQNLGAFANANKLIPAGNSLYWFINNGKVALANFTEPGKIKLDSSKFSILNGRMVQDYENISKINENLFLISVDDGFVLYNQQVKDFNPVKPSVFIGNITNITATNVLITESGLLSENIKINPTESNIRIFYSLPYYRQAKIEYQYYLEGYSKKWSEWSSAPEKDFTNLSFGKYSFKVRARINENEVTDEAVFHFEILPPFYATTWAFIFYFLLFVLAVFLVRKWYFRKLARHQKNIERQLQLEKEEHIRKEAIENEQRLIKLRNEKLKAELDSKSREMANSAMNMVYKNELLQKIRNQILNLRDEQGKKLSEDQLRKIQKVIDEGMHDERDWNLFETSFNETHENFFKRLKHNHPALVPNDLKLCAYLRMNMSSKEMASLLNISVRGVELRRYRLRKKLDVPHDKNLVEFLMEL